MHLLFSVGGDGKLSRFGTDIYRYLTGGIDVEKDVPHQSLVHSQADFLPRMLLWVIRMIIVHERFVVHFHCFSIKKFGAEHSTPASIWVAF